MWQLFSEQQITCIKDKNGLDMLLRENVDIFKMWEARISTDNLKVKIGIQHGLYYITGNAATKWKETFLLQLHYFCLQMLATTSTMRDRLIYENQKLQIQSEVKLLRASIWESIKKVTSDIINTLIDKSLYVELRNAVCVKFIIYNEQRRKEPARLFIGEF